MIIIDVEDIYFLIGLSQRGTPISLSSYQRAGETIKYYVTTYCDNYQPSSDGKIAIKYNHQLPLKIIMFTITCLAGSTYPHLATKCQIEYALECFRPIVFNSCEGNLANVKEQLNMVKVRWLNNFVYFFCRGYHYYDPTGYHVSYLDLERLA